MLDISNVHLFTHNSTYLLGAVLNIILVCVVLYVRRHKIDNLVVTFILMTLSVVVFQVSQVLGANAATADISRKIFMFNLAVIPIQVFMTHWFLALMGKTKEKHRALTIVYVTGSILFLVHVIFPETYLLDSIPKLYFPFYYEPGSLQWVTRTWFHLVGAYYFWILLRAYRSTIDPVIKNRYLFTLLAVLYGFIIGESAVFLIYDIQFDPMWSSFFSVYTFLIAYAILRYQLLDVRFLIRRAFVYGVLITLLVGFLVLVNSSSELIKDTFPLLPNWIVLVVSSIIAVILGIVTWSKLQENDHIKYQFITVIAHKFRTPLTQTRWATEELARIVKDPDGIRNMSYIKESNEKLINLVGILLELAEKKDAIDGYHFEAASLPSVVSIMIKRFQGAFEKKKIRFSVDMSTSDVRVHIDRNKFNIVLQTLFENSIAYTSTGGSVEVRISSTSHKAYISIIDTGMGIKKEDLSHIFSQFYRADEARLKDTEGLGVGLFLAQFIMKRHTGKIVAHSKGTGKGSEFILTLPRVL